MPKKLLGVFMRLRLWARCSIMGEQTELVTKSGGEEWCSLEKMPKAHMAWLPQALHHCIRRRHTDCLFRHARNYALSLHSIKTNYEPAFTHTHTFYNIYGKLCGINFLKSDELEIKFSTMAMLLLFFCAGISDQLWHDCCPTTSILPRPSALWL